MAKPKLSPDQIVQKAGQIIENNDYKTIYSNTGRAGMGIVFITFLIIAILQTGVTLSDAKQFVSQILTDSSFFPYFPYYVQDLIVQPSVITKASRYLTVSNINLTLSTFIISILIYITNTLKNERNVSTQLANMNATLETMKRRRDMRYN